jgi:hypothetical protein
LEWNGKHPVVTGWLRMQAYCGQITIVDEELVQGTVITRIALVVKKVSLFEL